MEHPSEITDPRATYGSPELVLEASDLERAEKRRILERWLQDEKQLAASQDEGMDGGRQSMLRRVSLALSELG